MGVPVGCLAAVLVLVVVLILVVILVLIVVLVLILVLLIHDGIPPFSFCELCREHSLPRNLRFILILD